MGSAWVRVYGRIKAFKENSEFELRSLGGGEYLSTYLSQAQCLALEYKNE